MFSPLPVSCVWLFFALPANQVYQTWIWRGYDQSKLPYLRGWVSGAPPGQLLSVTVTHCVKSVVLWKITFSSFIWMRDVQSSFSIVLGKLLLLDQTAEREPLWSLFGDYAFFNTSFIWCAMHEMGGNVGMFGNLQTVADGTMKAWTSGHTAQAGIGIDPEGINQNPAYYEMTLEAAWRNATIDVQNWLSSSTSNTVDSERSFENVEVTGVAGASWASQRCGTSAGSAKAELAWKILGTTV